MGFPVLAWCVLRVWRFQSLSMQRCSASCVCSNMISSSTSSRRLVPTTNASTDESVRCSAGRSCWQSTIAAGSAMVSDWCWPVLSLETRTDDVPSSLRRWHRTEMAVTTIPCRAVQISHRKKWQLEGIFLDFVGVGHRLTTVAPVPA